MSAAAIIAHVTEISVTLAFLVALLNAGSQKEGRRHVATVLWGGAAGFSLEYLLVHSKEATYKYGENLFWAMPWDVPVFIGLGWGTIFYISTWTAERLSLKRAVSTAFAAGILAVNLDLSLDPTAAMNGFWTWKRIPFDHCFFGIPFDNFISWVAVIAAYNLSTKIVFEIGQKKLPSRRAVRALRDFILPPIGALGAAGLFALARSQFDAIYHGIGRFFDPDGKVDTSTDSMGQAVIFIGLFVFGLVVFSRSVSRAKRDQPVNWIVLGLAIFFHVLSVFLFLFGIYAKRSEPVTFTPIAVLIPINAIVGFLAFAWPSIDILFKKGEDEKNPVRFAKAWLSSYSGGETGGDTVRATVTSPSSKEELRAVLAYAKLNGTKVTFRGGCHAFDSQSLNDELVVSLARLKTIDLDADKKTVTVQCGATWREILEKTLPAGLAPHVMVTSGTATAGGTLSAHSVSRFSAIEGREGKHVASFEIVTPDGQVRKCSRKEKENADVFGAAIGGLGYVGAVFEITYRLRTVPKNARVQTEYNIFEGIPSIAKAIEVTALQLAQELKACCKRAKKAGSGKGGTALSSAMYLRGGIRGLVASSTYVAGDTPLQPSAFHTPHSFMHRLLQFCALIPLLRNGGFWYAYNHQFRGKTTTFVDEAHGYTFFEDGNVWVRKVLKAIGVPVPIAQQTFIIPAGDDDDDDEPKLKEFFEKAAELFKANRVAPALVDLLYVPADDAQDDFLLSSSHGLAGFAVTYTFESMFLALTKERAVLEELSEACARLDGRVHLVKNVCAKRATIKKMYAARFARMNAVRKRVGAEHVHNEFADRILDGI